jgi:hypothetical protein
MAERRRRRLVRQEKIRTRSRTAQFLLGVHPSSCLRGPHRPRKKRAVVYVSRSVLSTGFASAQVNFRRYPTAASWLCQRPTGHVTVTLTCGFLHQRLAPNYSLGVSAGISMISQSGRHFSSATSASCCETPPASVFSARNGQLRIFVCRVDIHKKSAVAFRSNIVVGPTQAVRSLPPPSDPHLGRSYEAHVMCVGSSDPVGGEQSRQDNYVHRDGAGGTRAEPAQ